MSPQLMDDLRLVARSMSDSVLNVSNPLNPSKFDSSHPITLFIIQLFIIIVFTHSIAWVFKFMNQPQVIAEVIAGILLGPTAFGRIPNFTHSIFPKESIPFLNLVSTIGLVLFLFVVGLEVDIGVVKKNGRNSAIISLVGMVLPFGLGAAVAVPVYANFVDSEKVSFGNFLLFLGVCLAITAFPVLCRILTACNLLDTKVGVIVLAAGVGNDVVGWALLALTLALVSGGQGVTAVYILLTAAAWSIVLLWPIRKGYVYLCRRSGSIENGPTPMIMTVTLLIVFGSAFMTSIIGVHPIFGGFLAGLIIPHEGGFAIAITERIEDLVSMLFLPIYFVLSGLQTNLAALDTGIIWGYIILITVVGFLGKFIGCAGIAKVLGYTWRESGAIGMLMSCKGLVELIVLNVGREAGIIDERLFSMLVLVAVFLTLVTTPGTLAIYPPQYRSRGSGNTPQTEAEIEKDNQLARAQFLNTSTGGAAGGREYTSRLLVVLQKLEHLAPVMFLTQLLEPTYTVSTNSSPYASDSEDNKGAGDTTTRPVHIDALKLVELTGRTFSVMQSAAKEQLLPTDDALQLFKQFGRLRGMDVQPHIDIVGQDSFPLAVSEYANDLGSELVLIPWTIPVNDPIIPAPVEASSSTTAVTPTATAFEGIFASDGAPMYTHFIRNLYSKTTADVALFVDRGFGSSVTPPGTGQHIFFPFFGGPDDRLALRLVVQLCRHANVTATVVRITHDDISDDLSDDGTLEGTAQASPKSAAHRKLTVSDARTHQEAFKANQLTVGGPKLDEQSRIVSETADNLAWDYYTTLVDGPSAAAVNRIIFTEMSSDGPLAAAGAKAEAAFLAAQTERMWRPLLVVVGRGRRAAAYSHERELTAILAAGKQNPTVGAELRKTVGDPATALIMAGGHASQASFLICEAGQ